MATETYGSTDAHQTTITKLCHHIKCNALRFLCVLHNMTENSNVKTNNSKYPTYGSEHYEMGCRHDRDRKRGRCVILNYNKFIDKNWCPTRNGSEHDVKKLRETFENLNFDVIVHLDLTEKLTKFVLRNESQFDHSDYFCFVLCILSHGQSEDLFMCIDSTTSTSRQGIPYEFLYQQFYGNKCITLANKPKLFFIQACRGEKSDTGANLANDFRSDNNQTDSKPQRRNVPDDPDIIPITKDLFIFHSCYYGFKAARNLKKGSLFIRHLCNALNQFSDQDELLAIMKKVKNSVSQNLQEVTVNNSTGSSSVTFSKQMPKDESTLVKHVYF